MKTTLVGANPHIVKLGTVRAAYFMIRRGTQKLAKYGPLKVEKLMKDQGKRIYGSP